MKDRIVRDFDAHGFRCVIGTGGPTLENFNGYVGIPVGHKWHGEPYGDIACEVHGGLTYGRNSLPWEEDGGDIYWIGFDTCHAGDIVLGVPIGNLPDETFKDEDYVASELRCLAEQAAQA